MRVELRAAEPREMLEASADSGRVEAREKLRGRALDGGRVIRSGAFSQNQSARGGQAAVDHRSQVHVEAETPERSPREISRRPRQPEPCGTLQRGRRRQHVPEAIDGSALLVEKEKSRPRLPQLGEQGLELRERLDVASEQNDAVRRMGGENVPFGVREPGPGDSDPEEPRAHFPLSRCCSAARRDSEATGVIWSRSTARSFSSASSSSAEKRRN